MIQRLKRIWLKAWINIQETINTGDSFYLKLLIPFSLVYKLLVSFRKWSFEHQVFETNEFFAPVIVIGNITVGGNGKTPFVIWLANYLQNKDYNPGIVTRGYGGNAKIYPYKVKYNSNVNKVGDEALLLAMHTRCPIVVDPNRSRGVEYLIKKYNCNIIISDDGLQHYALGRKLEIVLLDNDSKWGNGRFLPSGPLRESKHRIEEVDFVVSTGNVEGNLGYTMKLSPMNLVNIKDTTNIKSLSFIKNKKVKIITAIAKPKRFISAIKKHAKAVDAHTFPDHYKFSKKDFAEFSESLVIMTEKDATKCLHMGLDNLWYLATKTIVSKNFVSDFGHTLKGNI